MMIKRSELRQIIREVIAEEHSRINEDSMQRAKVSKPLSDLYTNLQAAKKELGKDGAKKAISDIVSSISDKSDVMSKAEKLLGVIKNIENNIDSILRWLNTPAAAELTKDPWAHVGKRG